MATSAYKWDWRHSEPVEATFPNGMQIRLTVATVSEREKGVYQTLLNEGRRLARERQGVEPSEVFADEGNEQYVERVTEFTWYHQRAYMLAALIRVETKLPDGEWQDDKLPEEWRNIETFAESIPAPLFEAWSMAVVDLNPMLFGVAADTESKNAVRVTWHALMN